MLIAIAICVLMAMILFVVYAMFYVGAGKERPLPPPAFDRYRELSPYFPGIEAKRDDRQAKTQEKRGRTLEQPSGERGPLRVHLDEVEQ